MNRLLKPALRVLGVFAAVWLLVFFYWQSISRMLGAGDVVLWLVLLPLGVLLAWWLLRRAGAAPAAVLLGASGTIRAAPKRTDKAAKTDVDETLFRVCVLASSLRAPGGASAQELIAAIAEGKGAAPDAQLKTDDGFPVFASRIAGLDTDALREQLAAMPLAPSADFDLQALTDDRLRAFQIMGDTLVDLLAKANETVDSIVVEDPRAARPLVLRISLLLPGGWSEPERLLAALWVQHLCAVERPALAWTVDSFRSEAGVTGFALLDRVIVSVNRELRQTLHIVLAAESALSDARVAQWEATGVLYTSTRRTGLMPGEAVAGLLLTATKDAGPQPGEVPQLGRPIASQRTTSADAARAGDASVLGALTDQLLTVAKLDAPAVEWLVSDADHRVSRVTEVAAFLQKRLPHVPFDSNHLITGMTCSHMGAAGDFVSLALGCQLASEHGQRVIVALLTDPFARAAVLVDKPLPPSSAAVA